MNNAWPGRSMARSLGEDRLDSCCTEPCCAEKRDLADAWQMLIEIYRVLVRAGAGSSEKRHRYSFNRRKQ